MGRWLVGAALWVMAVALLVWPPLMGLRCVYRALGGGE